MQVPSISAKYFSSISKSSRTPATIIQLIRSFHSIEHYLKREEDCVGHAADSTAGKREREQKLNDIFGGDAERERTRDGIVQQES